MRPIDADALDLDREVEMADDWNTAHEIANCVKYAPTIDAVPVVRCKDCRHRDPEDRKCDSGEVERQGCVFPVDDDYFCAYGER